MTEINGIFNAIAIDFANELPTKSDPMSPGPCVKAIAESCSGLRIGSMPGNLTPVEHQSGSAIFMLASNFQKVMDTDKVCAGWHDVVQVDKSLIGKPFARWAIVAFVEAHGVEALPRTETHKWYDKKIA